MQRWGYQNSNLEDIENAVIEVLEENCSEWILNPG